MMWVVRDVAFCLHAHMARSVAARSVAAHVWCLTQVWHCKKNPRKHDAAGNQAGLVSSTPHNIGPPGFEQYQSGRSCTSIRMLVSISQCLFSVQGMVHRRSAACFAQFACVIVCSRPPSIHPHIALNKQHTVCTAVLLLLNAA